MKRLTREELRVGALMYPPVDIPRPTTRAECREEMRPCPWVACKHHLYLDINPETGSIKINFPDLEPWELKHTCALDVAERGGITLEEVGEIMNLTRERIRQVEVRGLLKLKMGSPSPDELGAELLAGEGNDEPELTVASTPVAVRRGNTRRMIRRALISVSDKRGVVELAKVLRRARRRDPVDRRHRRGARRRRRRRSRRSPRTPARRRSSTGG